MASHIAALGVLKYEASGDGQRCSGSVTFPGDVSSMVVSKPVKTGDGRSIKYVEHTLTVRGFIFNNDTLGGTAPSSGTCDNAFDGIRQTLSQPSGKLTITGKGFGDIIVNRALGATSGQYFDIIFGPFPEVVEWEPFGNVSCKFTWRVKFTLPWKAYAVTKPGILDFWWSTTYDYDSEGFCDRTITGEMEITGTRVFAGRGEVGANSSIENLLEDNLRVDCPVGYHRKTHNISINPSKTIANFTFVDEQDRGFTYPPGISQMDIRHEMVSEANNSTLTKWIWAIHVTATPEAKFPAVLGFSACVEAFRSRYLFMLGNLANQFGNIVPLLMQMKVTEDVKSRTTTFMACYGITAVKGIGGGQNATAAPQDILLRCGMWQPFLQFSPAAHKQVADSGFGPNRTGGYTEMRMMNNQNIITDISGNAPFVPDPGRAFANVTNPRFPKRFDTLILSPYGVYIEFRVQVSVKIEGGAWINYPMVSINKNAHNLSNFDFATQDVAKPYNTYAVTGIIVRVGIPPEEIPPITKIGDLKVRTKIGSNGENYNEVNTFVVGNVGGDLVWATTFKLYFTPVRPDSSNPIKAPDGGTASRNKPTDPAGKPIDKVKADAIVKVPEKINITDANGNVVDTIDVPPGTQF